MEITADYKIVFTINKFESVVVQYKRELVESKGEVNITKGERVIALELQQGKEILFCIRKKSGCMLYLPASLFNNNFNTFKSQI